MPIAAESSLRLGDQAFRRSPWWEVERVRVEPLLPLSPGLYRLRRRGRPGLDYLGQTRRTLRGRVRMLGGVFGDEMPFRDLHTAGPALWAMRHANPCSFEVSVVEVDTEPSWRKGLEALAISLYRQRWHESPTVNFGRMPAGYRMSSGRNARLAAAGRQFRGGPSTEQMANHKPSLPPAGPLDDDLHGRHWCGHEWSDWVALEHISAVGPISTGIRRQHPLRERSGSKTGPVRRRADYRRSSKATKSLCPECGSSVR